VIPRTAKAWRLGELAAALGAECAGERSTRVDGVASLDRAGPSDLAAVYDARAAAMAAASEAGVLVAEPALCEQLAGRPLLLGAAPKALFARAIELVCPRATAATGVHPSAQVGRDVVIGEGSSVGPLVAIGDGCRIGTGVVIGPGSVLLDGVVIGDRAVLHPRVVVYPKTEIGADCELLAGAVVGAPGFGHARDAEGRVVRVPHLGRVVLGQSVEIGANSTVDRATFGVTRIGDRTKIDNLVQIGHNADVGTDVMIAAQSGVSGSSTVEDGVVMGGQSGVADHIRVGRGAAVAAKTAVMQDVREREVVAGSPAIPIRRWRRVVAVQARLPEMWAALRGIRSSRSDRSREGDES
jgi:UDP-3-O-[3-hydroxymyristoyl] glucosamine N-acyltransferase